ncbi:hypothetical protein IEQ34_006860 [Dendrobium chrysotoxum]|uniref:Putative plant transposon protein domain-containing protein n=1 Tax=Dendrobium chrysotoxum TaxID=161865 RepID=A0AAV7H8S9_DENCH|nr:hypothetical protein IEQ34_006860 [Dendrobium chrysotoxum]
MARWTSKSRKKKAETYNKFKFISEAAESRFVELVASSPLIAKCRFLYPTPLIFGWAHFCEEPYAAMVNVVREFYANRKESSDYSCFMIGKWVPFEFLTINRILNHAPFDSQLILDLLYRPNSGVRWRTIEEKIVDFPASYLTQTSKAWHYFISTCMLPSKNISKVTTDRALLNYTIQKCYTINVGKLILSSIMYIIRGSPFVGLGLPSLIYTLCVATRVRRDQNEE